MKVIQDRETNVKLQLKNGKKITLTEHDDGTLTVYADMNDNILWVKGVATNAINIKSGGVIR